MSLVVVGRPRSGQKTRGVRAVERGRLWFVRCCAWVAAALLGLTGCTGEATTPEPPQPELELGFTQLLPEEGTEHALVRVINHEPEPITVTELGIDWPGYGGASGGPIDEKVVPADSELMLRVDLPDPVCTTDAPPDDPVEGRLTIDGRDLIQPLTDPAQVYVRRLWRTQCDQELLDSTVRIAFARDHEQVTGPEGDWVRTTLLLTRVGGDQPVEITSAEGSVLYNLRVAGHATLPPAAETARVELDILPGNRCDEHAIGQATAPYDFLLLLRIGDRRVSHPTQPPLPVQNAASTMLLRHCGEVGR